MSLAPAELPRVISTPGYLRAGLRYGCDFTYAPRPVHGGWMIVHSQWVRDPFVGWDQVETLVGETVFLSREACEAGIARLSAPRQKAA